ncbi:OTU domain-containing protein 5-B [Tribolium madens]|uniref:OTU domain-containing protein 5-B n=1 Tax=Tribolium madens TaxID=41895 RepID=UPI001CF71D41|nr:OTU domain-containing protein 5-B [Tribolium madens]
MTILPTKRPSANPEEKSDNSQQNGNSERTVRRRDDISSLNEASPSNRRSQFPYVKSTTERKERLRKRYKEPDRPRDREREREQKREVRREQKRERVAKRDISNEPLHDNNANNSVVDSVVVEPTCNNNEPGTANKEDYTGFNSEDEYDDQGLLKERNIPDEEWQKRDVLFSRGMSNLGFEIKQMNEDGACLFRSIADQVYGDQEFHYQVRQDCMNYIVQNRDYFEPYVTEDFDKYVARKRIWNVHGNHLEIQAMSELYNRTIEVYCYQITPINIFNGSRLINSYEPIRLSYHRMCHYNSISNPNKPSVGVGLGLPNYHTVDIDRRRFNDALRASDELLIEQTMLEDKLKATDFEATNEAIEEQVARESYIQYFRDSERRLKNQGHSCGSSSTITSATMSSSRSSRKGSVSPKGSQSPKGPNSPKTTPLASPRSASISSPSTSRYEGDGNGGDVAGACGGPPEEFPKFSPRRAEPPAEDINHPDYDENFSEDFKFDFDTSDSDQAAGPSHRADLDYDDYDQEIMAQVLAESRKTYLAELKQRSKKRHGSPGPSTSS